MSYELLEQKIKAIPLEYLEDFGVYVDNFLSDIQMIKSSRHLMDAFFLAIISDNFPD